MTSKEFAKPVAVRDLGMVFPARALEIMPSREECQAGLAALMPETRRAWLEFARQWFHPGLPANTECHPVEGVDARAAMRHLCVILGSYAPKHEHKEEAVAYLASRWFSQVPAPPADREAP